MCRACLDSLGTIEQSAAAELTAICRVLCGQQTSTWVRIMSARVLRFGTILVLSLTLTALSKAQDAVPDTSNATRVEEDWVAYIRNADPNTGAPQITNVISPLKTTECPFGLVELNHRSIPSFSAGGYSVQSWLGDVNNDFVLSQETNQLQNDYDKLEYTVGMMISDENIRFFLKDGKSRTWGRFARWGISAVAPKHSLNLSGYDPQYSVDNTTVNLGAHRVELLYQKEVRYYDSSGDLIHRDETPRIIHRFREVIQFVSLEEYEQNEQYFNIEITE